MHRPAPTPTQPVRLILAASCAVLVAGFTPLSAQETSTPAQRLKKPATEELGTPAGTTTMPEVVVTAEATGYAAPPTASTALKTSARLLDTPQAVSVVSRQLIEDQDAAKLEDILKNVAGVSIGGFFGEWDYYRIRGFDVGYTETYIDGLQGDSAPGEEPFGAERVEVVKGPASTLYGQGPLGGLVNIVSKRPVADNFADVRFTMGSYELYEPSIDAGLVLNADKTVYMRLLGLYRKSNHFVDYAGRERIFIAPSITWEITPDTSLTILSSWRSDNDDLAYALPAYGTVLPNRNGHIPRNRYIGIPGLGNDENERIIRLGYEFKHSFNEHLKFRQNFRYHWLYSTSTDLSYPAFLDTDERTLAMSGYSNVARYDGLRIDTALDADFNTGPVKHILTVGVDYRQTTQRYDARDAIDLAYMDVFRPRYNSIPKYVYGPSYLSKDSDSDFGIYLQEQAKFFDKVTLTLGGRYDISEYDSHPGKHDDDAFTPKAGLTYEFLPGMAAYANYTRSYKPQWFSTDAAGNPVAPEEGENWEAGLKFDLFGGKLTSLISVYQLTRENVATDNIATPDPSDAIVAGEQRSRGFEFELSAEITKGLDFTVAYSYIDAEITEDNVIPVGTTTFAVPEHSVSAWLKYTLQEGPLKGLGFGVGGRYYTEQGGDETYTSSFVLPAYGIVDCGVYYDRGPFHAQVNVNNVLDREYYVGSYSDLYVLPGEPLTVRATVGWTF